MRHLEQILEDKKKNDEILAKAIKTDKMLLDELSELYTQVGSALGKDAKPMYRTSAAAQVAAVDAGKVIPR